MYYYRLIISYCGTNYFGWQIQNNAPEKTIQEELNIALAKLAKDKSVKSVGSGRTDAGVHALGQVVHVELPIEINCTGLKAGLNSLLSKDIRVLSVSRSEGDFHPIFHAKSKRYNYYFSKKVGPFDHNLITEYPYDLDLDMMNLACNLFIGEHDFKDFYCIGTPVNTTKRTIFDCSLTEARLMFPFGENQVYKFSVSGTGFMKQMVRLMVGTLWNVARGKTSLDDLELSLKGLGNRKLGIVAPPQGLYLVEVVY